MRPNWGSMPPPLGSTASRELVGTLHAAISLWSHAEEYTKAAAVWARHAAELFSVRALHLEGWSLSDRPVSFCP